MDGLFGHLVLCLALSTIVLISGLEIKKEIKKSCSVLTDKGEIDLSSVAKTDGQSYAFESDPHGLGAPFYVWNPCYDTTAAQYGQCDKGQLFEIPSGSNDVCKTLGGKDTASFSVRDGHVWLDYTSNDQDNHIRLVCPSKDSLEDDPNHFEQDDTCDDGTCFTLTDPVCCFKNVAPTPAPHAGLSGGSILLIILFVFLVVYVIAGVLFMKFAKGAQGTELVPNVKFWKALPFFVKDGVVFLFKGCKTNGGGSSSYDNI